MKQSIITSCLVLLLAGSAATSFAQCKGFTRRVCFPLLGDYVHNGRFSSGKLAQGQTAEIKITFSSEHKYRLLIKGHEALGNIQFKVYDQTKKQLIYDNANKDYKSTWDFNLTNTQPLIIEIIVPPTTNINDLKHSGCVSVIIGYKIKE